MSGQVESKIQMEVVATHYSSHEIKPSSCIKVFNRAIPVMRKFPTWRIFWPNKRRDIIAFDHMDFWIPRRQAGNRQDPINWGKRKSTGFQCFRSSG